VLPELVRPDDGEIDPESGEHPGRPLQRVGAELEACTGAVRRKLRERRRHECDDRADRGVEADLDLPGQGRRASISTT
jgi:hypothetical protein